jgi:hypothetical protein
VVNAAAATETFSERPTSSRPASVTIFRDARSNVIRAAVARFPFLLRQYAAFDRLRDARRLTSRHVTGQYIWP